jgi:hypothetical protein
MVRTESLYKTDTLRLWRVNHHIWSELQNNTYGVTARWNDCEMPAGSLDTQGWQWYWTEGQWWFWENGVLILDAFKGHLTPEISATITGSSMSVDHVVIPGGMNSHLQVWDVMVNRPFKNHLKLFYGNWCFGGDFALTSAGQTKKPNVILLCQRSSWHGSSSHQKWLWRCLSSVVCPLQWMGLDCEDGHSANNENRVCTGGWRQMKLVDTDWWRWIELSMFCVLTVWKS